MRCFVLYIYIYINVIETLCLLFLELRYINLLILSAIDGIDFSNFGFASLLFFGFKNTFDYYSFKHNNTGCEQEKHSRSLFI